MILFLEMIDDEGVRGNNALKGLARGKPFKSFKVNTIEILIRTPIIADY